MRVRAAPDANPLPQAVLEGPMGWSRAPVRADPSLSLPSSGPSPGVGRRHWGFPLRWCCARAAGTTGISRRAGREAPRPADQCILRPLMPPERTGSAMIDVVLPSGESESSGNTVGKWFRSVGDPVRKDDPLLEIITDKVTVEIAAPADGVLAEILKPEGEQVEPGEVVGRIEAGVAAGAGAAQPPAAAGAPASSEPVARAEPRELSPAVRRLIEEPRLHPARIKRTR